MRLLVPFVVLCALAAWIAWNAASTPSALETPPLLPAARARELDHAARIDDPRARGAASQASAREQAPASAAATRVADPTKATLRVRVVSSDDGTPLEGSRVHASTDRRRSDGTLAPGSGGATATTDEHGLVSLTVMAGVELRVSVPFRAAHASKLVAVPPLASGDQREVLIEVKTRPDQVVRGIVVDAGTSQPIVNAVVRAVEDDRAVLDAREIEQTLAPPPGAVLTASDGSFALEVRSWSDETLLADAPWYVAAAHALREDSSAGVRIELVAAAALCIQFVPQPNASLDLVLVTAHLGDERLRSAAALDGESRACFEIVPGEQRVALEVVRVRGVRESMVIARADVRFTATAGAVETVETVETVEIVERPTSPVTGCLRDEQAGPVANARVSIVSAESDLPLLVAFDDDRRRVAHAVTDERGCFTAPDVPVGRYWLVLDPHRPPLGQHPSFAAVGTPFTLDVGGVPTLDVRCTAAQWIEGRVLDGEVGCETAYVRAESSAWSGSLRVATRKGGRFWLGPLPAGTFDVVAEGDDARADSARVQAAAGASGIVLERPSR